MSTPKGVTITPEVEAVLRDGTTEGDLFLLPPGQLDRKLYVAVNKALAALGGKWNRRRKGHVVGPRFAVALAETLGTGFALDADKTLGFFPTPPEVGVKVIDYLQPYKDCTVLEPSAGEGALLRELFGDPCAPKHEEVVAVEIDPYRASALSLAFHGVSVEHGDFLAHARSSSMDHFDRILMNPPFGNGVEIEHVDAALSPLAVGGRLVAVLPAGVKTNTAKKFVAFRALIEGRGGVFHDLPEASFKSSGTGVNTCLLVIGD